MSDVQRYRVTRVCTCAADYAEGYGATLDEAKANVRKFWRKGGHREKDVAGEIIERVTNDGARYVEVQS